MVGGNITMAEKWRPKTPPVEPIQEANKLTVPVELDGSPATPRVGEGHTTAATSLNGHKPDTVNSTVSTTNPKENITVDNPTEQGKENENGSDPKTSWSHLFKDSPEKSFKLQYYEPDPKQREIVSIPELTTSQGSVGWENIVMGFFLDKKNSHIL